MEELDVDSLNCLGRISVGDHFFDETGKCYYCTRSVDSVIDQYTQLIQHLRQMTEKVLSLREEQRGGS